MGDWSTKATWMREAGATQAEWHPDGTLRSCTLAPLVPADDNADPADPKETPQARQIRERTERRDLAMRASGGPVRRLSDDA